MNHAAFFPRLKCFFALLLLMIADIIPIPILGLICMFILLFRPRWFKELVDNIYGVEIRADEQ
jgi:MFS superfamily sulfate permease-like transporter